MKILLWHGYLLRGTGSNIYTSNLARAWRAAGHDVLVMCQERAVAELEFVDAHGDFAPDNRSFEVAPTGVPAGTGRVHLARPAIGEILPVYVYDDYEGFTVARFVDLADADLAHYTDANVVAMITAIEGFRPDAIITGHEVMGPEIARRACTATGTRYVAKLHGSALEYAVKEQRRYLEFAVSGLGGAAAVVGGSEYMVREAARTVPGWVDRARVVNPGCDVELFVPAARASGVEPVIGFVGKLIASKGVHDLLAALGLTSTPSLRVVIVGYGGFERDLGALWDALSKGRLDAARSIAAAGALDSVVRFLDSGAADDGYLRRAATVEVDFTGRLEHGPLSRLLPTFDALVVPSVVPEAFGMVAAEAAACGVLPIVPDHSGIGEAGAAVEDALGAPGLLTFDSQTPIESIAAAIDRVLSLPDGLRREYETRASALAHERWSWDHVAHLLLAHALAAAQ